MASCSRAFRKPKTAEEERKLIENAFPKSTSAAGDKMLVSENVSGMAEW